jgi:hypothetical protein
MVPKTNATTLANFDKRAARKLEQRKLATAKQPLARRSVVWPATDSASADGEREVFPWEKKPGPTTRKRKYRAKRTSNNSWYSLFGSW